jgi:hypothetical protein
MSPVYAIRETAIGDVSLAAGETTNANVAWSVPRGGAYMATPLVYRDLVHVLGWNGVMLVFDAKTGERAINSAWATGQLPFRHRPWRPTARSKSRARKATCSS